MKILYSKQSIKTLLNIDERIVAEILEKAKGVMENSPKVKKTVLTGYSQRRYMFYVEPYYVIIYPRVFKGDEVYYVSQILHKEDLEYFIE